jgi:hypothetical protein
VDPLNISKRIPGGSIHVDRAAGYYKVDLWLKNIVMHGLSRIHLRQVKGFQLFSFLQQIFLQVQILRSSDLKEMEIGVKLGLGDLMVNGTYNATGHLGTVWLQLPMDSEGDQLFQLTLVNATLMPQFNIDAEAACDPEKNVRITEFNIPLLYDSVASNFENLDTAFETVIQGIVIFLLESQNIVLESTLRSLLSKTIINIMCP